MTFVGAFEIIFRRQKQNQHNLQQSEDNSILNGTKTKETGKKNKPGDGFQAIFAVLFQPRLF